jgi:predicted O-methyltransferase YrrM
MVPFVRSLVPSFVRDLRALGRTRRENTRMEAAFQSPRPELLRNTRVLASRLDLLREMPKGAVCAEVGVAAGAFAQEILALAEPAKLHLIDAWNYPPQPDCFEPGLAKVRARFAAELATGRVEIHRGLSLDMLGRLPDRSLDWIYIDAGHDYDNVVADLAGALRVVKPGGIIAGDDYLRYDTPFHRYGVIEAVNALANRHGAEFLYLTMDYDTNFAIRLPG